MLNTLLFAGGARGGAAATRRWRVGVLGRAARGRGYECGARRHHRCASVPLPRVIYHFPRCSFCPWQVLQGYLAHKKPPPP